MLKFHLILTYKAKNIIFLHELNQNYKLSVIYFTYLCTYSDKYSGGHFDILVFIVYTF